MHSVGGSLWWWMSLEKYPVSWPWMSELFQITVLYHDSNGIIGKEILGEEVLPAITNIVVYPFLPSFSGVKNTPFKM